jgi:hypothetical protein
MHQIFGSDNIAAKRGPYCLVAQTDSQNGRFAREFTYHLNADAGILRGAGTWGQHDALWVECFYFIKSNLVVPPHLYIGT